MKYKETECAGDGGTSSIMSNAPENTINIEQNTKEKMAENYNNYDDDIVF
jgi:hypothetical protein